MGRVRRRREEPRRPAVSGRAVASRPENVNRLAREIAASLAEDEKAVELLFDAAHEIMSSCRPGVERVKHALRLAMRAGAKEARRSSSKAEEAL